MTIPIVPLKPSPGQPCNGCGYCCREAPCLLAQEVLNCRQGPCVALEYEDARAYCGLVRHPARHMFSQEVPPGETARLSVLFASMLGLGQGCDADDPRE